MALSARLPPPGTRVRVTQQLPQRDRAWTNTVEGALTRYQQAKTGSWFAHAKTTSSGSTGWSCASTTASW